MKVEMYSKDNCPWCDQALKLLQSVNVNPRVYKYNVDFSKEDLIEIIGPDKPVTVPQVIINGKLVGGFDDLKTYLQDNGIFGLQT